jgi:HAD superfamily hydrolase (TIGR01509 family)
VTPLRGLLCDYSGVLDRGPEVLAAVRRLRAVGVATALVSDASAVPDEVAAAFDVVVLGRVLGVGKPDPEVFRRAAAALGLAAEACVVVDDAEVNLRGARAAGSVVVRHRDAASTVAELDLLLG